MSTTLQIMLDHTFTSIFAQWFWKADPPKYTFVHVDTHCHMVTSCQPPKCRKYNVVCMNTGRTAWISSKHTCLCNVQQNQKKMMMISMQVQKSHTAQLNW